MDREQAEKKNKEALVLYRSQEYKNAVHKFNEAIKLNENVSQYWLNRAACHIKLKDYHKAIADAGKSIDIDENYIKGYKLLSRCNIILDEINFALKYIQKAQELNPNDEYCNKEHEKIKLLLEYDIEQAKFFNENKFSETFEITDKYLQLVPESKKFMLLKAECLILLHKFEEGARIIELLKHTQEDNDVLYVKALYDYYRDYITTSFESLRNIKKFIHDDSKINKLFSNARKTLELLELINKKNDENKLTDAYKLIERAINIDPNNYKTNKQLFYQKIIVTTKCKELKNNVITDCNNYLKKYNENLEILKIRAAQHMSMQNYEEAIDDYEAILKLETYERNKTLLDTAKLRFKEQLKNNYRILKIEPNETNQIIIKRAYQELNIKYQTELEDEDNQLKIVKINEKIDRITKAYNEITNENIDLLEHISLVRKLLASKDFSQASILVGKIAKNNPNDTESICMQTCLIYIENYNNSNQ